MLKLREEKIEPIAVDSVTDDEEIEKSDGVNEEIVNKAFENSINSLIQSAWDLNANIESVIATLEFEYKENNAEDVKTLLSNVIDDITINIGMLYKAIDLVNNKTTDLIETGKEKAEEILN